MFYKVLLHHESLTLPLNNAKERFEIIFNIDPYTLKSDDSPHDADMNILQLSCIGIDQHNYGVKDTLLTIQPLNSESSCTLPGMQCSSSTRRDKPGSRIIVIEPHYLPDTVQEIWVLFGLNHPNDTQYFNHWPKGSIQIRCGFQTWEWPFPSSPCADTQSFQPLALARLRNTWVARFAGKVTLLSIQNHTQKIMTPASFHSHTFSEQPAQAHTHISSDHALESNLPEGLLELYNVAQPYFQQWNITPERFSLIVIIDFSILMEPFFSSGDISKLLKLFTGLAAHAKHNGEFEVFLAAKQLIRLNAINWDLLKNPDNLTNPPMIQNWINTNTFSQRLNYGQLISEIRKIIYPANQGGSVTTLCQDRQPTWVLNLVSHDANDNAYAQWQLRWASHEPIFLQFLAMTHIHQDAASPRTVFHKGNSATEYNFSFLHSLATLENCLLPNTDFVVLSHIHQLYASALYPVLIKEYGEWLQAGIKAGALEGESATAKKLLTSVKDNIFD